VIYDDGIADRSHAKHDLFETVRAGGVPLLCVSDVQEPAGSEPWVQRPFTPLELLGAASCAQPELYGAWATDTVEPDLDDKLLLISHDLRRVAGECPRDRRVEEQNLARAALALVDTLALRDIETARHCYRVQAYARTLARQVAPAILEDETTELGFLLHDIGKLALPDRIMQKPGPLTWAERGLMQTHPVVGAEMAGRFLGDGHGLNVIRFHHERWDGTGYPDGLVGAAIPIEARVFAVADALDAMTSDRPYRRALPWHAAVDALLGEGGMQFDPAVITALENDSVIPRADDPVG
jgi:ribonuclease P protein subunit RPR2